MCIRDSLEADSLAFSYCQVPIVYRLADAPAVELTYADGRIERVDGDRLARSHSLSLFQRRGEIERLTVLAPRKALAP